MIKTTIFGIGIYVFAVLLVLVLVGVEEHTIGDVKSPIKRRLYLMVLIPLALVDTLFDGLVWMYNDFKQWFADIWEGPKGGS